MTNQTREVPAVLTVLYVNGGWVSVAQDQDNLLLVGALGATDACDALTFPPPLDTVPADGAAGFVSLAQLRAWGEAVSDTAAVQARELEQIVETWAKKHTKTNRKAVALHEEKDMKNV